MSAAIPACGFESCCTVRRSVTFVNALHMSTVQRVAKAWLDITAGYSQNVDSVLGQALFDEPTVSSGGGGMVLVSALTLLPSSVKLHSTSS